MERKKKSTVERERESGKLVAELPPSYSAHSEQKPDPSLQISIQLARQHPLT
jgi:hypothetical protein